ncbi:choice-of-anchor D domain-containing protein [bacterium]|nr:choice-of-anchor D domain-containing protein [bacterium]
MQRWISLTTLAGFLLPMFLFAQPVLRDGWPHDYGEENVAGISMINPLAVQILEDGTWLIATGTPHDIRLYNRNGTLLAEWPVAGTLADPLSADSITAGPNIGDVDGDGEPEIVVGLRDFGAFVRGIGVYDLDGTIDQTLTQSFSMSSTNFSQVVLENLDDDPALEIAFTAGYAVHVIDQDGSELAGFPWDLGFQASHAWTGIAVVPSAVTGGSPVLVWMSTNYQMHARAVGEEQERPGWPVSFESLGGINRAGPVIIPQPNGWYVAVVDPGNAHLWDQDGVSPEGFPRPLPTGSGPLSWMSAADVDGDNSPELLFRCSYNANLHAINLRSEYVPLYPLALSAEGTGNAQTVAMKTSFSAPAHLFLGAKGPELSDVSFMGYRDGQPLPGFPVDFTVTEWQARPRVALFPQDENGLMSIVVHTTFGYTAVYDLEVELEDTATLEWAMPSGQPGGNPVYRPTLLGQEDAPFFRFSVDTLQFGELLVFDEAEGSVTIENLGSEAGEVTALEVEAGEFDADFNVEPAVPFTLDPGASETVTLTWSPEDPYLLEGTLTITHDPAPSSTETAIRLEGEAGQPPVLLFPSHLDYGIVTDPMAMETINLEIENDGSGVGRIDTVLVPQDVADVLTIQAEFPLILPPSSTGSILLTWEPVVEGVLMTEIEMLHNDPFLGYTSTIYLDGIWSVGVDEDKLPVSYSLEQNHPNPFNPETVIRYSLAQPGDVKLTVFTIEGRELISLVDGYREAGIHNVRFNGHTLASGVYLYRLETNQFRALRKMILIR